MNRCKDMVTGAGSIHSQRWISTNLCRHLPESSHQVCVSPLPSCVWIILSHMYTRKRNRWYIHLMLARNTRYGQVSGVLRFLVCFSCTCSSRAWGPVDETCPASHIAWWRLVVGAGDVERCHDKLAVCAVTLDHTRANHANQYCAGKQWSCDMMLLITSMHYDAGAVY